MRKIFFAAVAGVSAFVLSCNSESKTDEPATKDTTAVSSVSYPYTATYSSSFEMGDPKNSEALLKLWKAWDNGDLSTTKDMFADSLNFNFRDGSHMMGPKDSILAGAQAFRNQYSAVQSKVAAFMPLKSTDKNENWVCIWGTEISTDKKGKIDSVYLQETWRFNKDGKADLVYQYGAVAKPQ